MDELDKPAAEAGGDPPSEHNGNAHNGNAHNGNAHGGNAHGGAPAHAALSAQELPAHPSAEKAAEQGLVDDEPGPVAGRIGPRESAESPDHEPAGEAHEAADEAPEQEPVEATADELEEEEEEELAEPAAAAEEPQEQPPIKLDWYILKVQSNREDSIADALARRIKIAGLDRYFDEIIVPIEKVSEFKNGKKRVVKRKLYPGYIVVHMELNDDTWFLVRETPGIGDFTGSGGKPTPMLSHEVNKIVAKQEDETEEQAVIDVKFKPGDRVRINEGTFENFEGDVDNIDMANGRVTVMINIFGRSTPVELEYWQVEGV